MKKNFNKSSKEDVKTNKQTNSNFVGKHRKAEYFSNQSCSSMNKQQVFPGLLAAIPS